MEILLHATTATAIAAAAMGKRSFIVGDLHGGHLDRLAPRRAVVAAIGYYILVRTRILSSLARALPPRSGLT
jgi:hypothetical protein